jgi:hypothetical protein
MEEGFISSEKDIFLPDETIWYQLGENKGTQIKKPSVEPSSP